MLNGLISSELFYEKEFTKERFNAFIGHRFEGICGAYLKKEFYNGRMSFFAEEMGSWWGNNPMIFSRNGVTKAVEAQIQGDSAYFVRKLGDLYAGD